MDEHKINLIIARHIQAKGIRVAPIERFDDPYLNPMTP